MPGVFARERRRIVAWPYEADTCDTAGVLNGAVGVIAAIEATEAIKLLAQNHEALHGRTDFLRRLEQQVPIDSRRPDHPRRRCMRSQHEDFSYLSWTAKPPAAHHLVRPRFRADSRAESQSSISNGTRLIAPLFQPPTPEVRSNDFLRALSRSHRMEADQIFT